MTLPDLKLISQIETRGRKDVECPQWVKTYEIKYTENGTDWIPYNFREKLTGNKD